MAKITFGNKQTSSPIALPHEKKLTSGDVNEIKASVNEIYDTSNIFLDYSNIVSVGAYTFTMYAYTLMKIDSTNVINGTVVSTVIKVNGVAYTLGDAISQGSKIDIIMTNINNLVLEIETNIGAGFYYSYNSSTFVNLSDVDFSDYVGRAHQVLQVNSTENGVKSTKLKTVGGVSLFGTGDISIGLIGDNYNTVLGDKGSEVDNGEELFTKFNDIKTWTPIGQPLSAENRVRLDVMGGVYDLGSNYIHFDTDFVDICSLDGNPIHLKTTHTENIGGIEVRCPIVVDDGVDSYISDVYCDEEYNVASPQPGVTNPVKSTFKVGDCPNLIVERCLGGVFSFSNYAGNLASTFNNNKSTGDFCFYGQTTNSGTFNNNTSTGDKCFYGRMTNSGTFNNNTSTGDYCFYGQTTNSGTFNNNTSTGDYCFYGDTNSGMFNNNTSTGDNCFNGYSNNSGTYNSNIGDGANNFDYYAGGNTGSIAINCQNKGGTINTEKIVNCINVNNQIINTDFQELKPIYINANTVTYYAPEDMSIDSVTDPSSIGTTINVNGVEYTLGNPISELDKIEISSAGTGVVNLHQTYKLHKS